MTNRLRPNRSEEYAWKALATIRLVNGGLALVAPRWLARRLGVRPELQPAMIYPLRMFGIRTILIGADLFLEPQARPRALRQGIVIHASDTAAALIAGVFGQLPVRSALMSSFISSVNTALAVYGARRLTKGRGRQG
jgi:hypothetical protein